MAKLKKMPSLARISGFKGVVDYYVHDGIPCARMWPRTPGHKRAPAVEAQWPSFRYIAGAWNSVSPAIQQAYRDTASSTNLSGRDYMVKNYLSHAYLELHGSPPLLSSPNPGYFLIIDINIKPYPIDPRVIVASDVPCHLWLYWTDIEPVKHPLTRIVRGIAMPWYTRYCFVAWHKVEQDEPGDTRTHSFTMLDWLPCQTRWFTIRGNIANELSPSVGPIFKHHMVGLIEANFIARTTDGFVYPYPPGPNYLEVHNRLLGYYKDTWEELNLAQHFYDPNYSIERVALFFDTSTIPATATIYSATLHLDLITGYADNFDIVIVPGDDLTEPLTSNSYHDLLDNILDLGYTTIIHPWDWYQIELNALGLAKINKQGITKLAMRMPNDILAIPPSASEGCQIYSADSDNKPYLTIQYY